MRPSPGHRGRDIGSDGQRGKSADLTLSERSLELIYQSFATRSYPQLRAFGDDVIAIVAAKNGGRTSEKMTDYAEMHHLGPAFVANPDAFRSGVKVGVGHGLLGA